MANVSHDQNFKNLILDYPRDALALFAAEEAPEPGDSVRIEPLRQEQLKERLGDRFRELDVPLQVEWDDGRRETVLFVIEEKTEPRRFSPHRLAHYCLDLAQMFETDRVVPVAIFLRGTATAGDGAAPLVLGTERRPYLTFHLAFRLAQTPYEDWRDSGNVAALVNLPNMRVPAERRVDAYADAVRGLAALETDPDRRAKYMEFIDAYADLDEDEYRRYERDHAEEQGHGRSHPESPRRGQAGGNADRSGASAAASVRAPVSPGRRTAAPGIRRRSRELGQPGPRRQHHRRGVPPRPLARHLNPRTLPAAAPPAFPPT